MQVRHCDNYESVTVKAIYHAKGTAPSDNAKCQAQFLDTIAEKQARAERLGLTRPVILALTQPLAGYTNRRRHRVHSGLGQGKQLSRLAVFCHHGLIRDRWHLASFVRGPSFPRFIGPYPVDLRVQLIEIRENSVYQTQLFNVRQLTNLFRYLVKILRQYEFILRLCRRHPVPRAILCSFRRRAICSRLLSASQDSPKPYQPRSLRTRMPVSRAELIFRLLRTLTST